MTTKSPYAHIYQWLADGEQIQVMFFEGSWLTLDERRVIYEIHAQAIPTSGFRVAPKTLTVNGVTFPEPMREAPKVGAEYWIPRLNDEECSGASVWRDDGLDLRWLSRGLCHSTKEAAELHAKALLSFTEVAK